MDVLRLALRIGDGMTELAPCDFLVMCHFTEALVNLKTEAGLASALAVAASAPALALRGLGATPSPS